MVRQDTDEAGSPPPRRSWGRNSPDQFLILMIAHNEGAIRLAQNEIEEVQ
jgi:uncharacterized protein (DUF305 family)